MQRIEKDAIVGGPLGHSPVLGLFGEYEHLGDFCKASFGSLTRWISHPKLSMTPQMFAAGEPYPSVYFGAGKYSHVTNTPVALF